MRTIVFSDTHLAHRFDPQKFKFLKKIIMPADKVIIAGDFWSICHTSFDRFVTSSYWQELFSLLKRKKAVYLFGNHDKRIYCDNRVSSFSQKQADFIKFAVGNKLLHIEHGNRLAPGLDGIFPWYKLDQPLASSLTFLAKYADEFGSFLIGKRFFSKTQYLNEKMKQWAKNTLSEGDILVCGHSHCAENNLENGFLNIGFIRHKLAWYLKIENDKIELVEERY